MAKVHDSENTVFAFEIVPVGDKLPKRHCVIPHGRNSRKPFSHTILYYNRRKRNGLNPKTDGLFGVPSFFSGGGGRTWENTHAGSKERLPLSSLLPPI